VITETNNFQRFGAVSNAHVGRGFEQVAIDYFRSQGIELKRDVPISIGHRSKKARRFDLADLEGKVVVECKSHTWTSGGNAPSAKIIVWNEAMYLFTLLPDSFRKVLFVARHLRKELPLADYYVKNYGYLIPPDVEVMEFCEATRTVRTVLGRVQS
jgi:hypothetical protein